MISSADSDIMSLLSRCGSAGIGRQARLRGVCESVWVQVPFAAPTKISFIFQMKEIFLYPKQYLCRIPSLRPFWYISYDMIRSKRGKEGTIHELKTNEYEASSYFSAVREDLLMKFVDEEEGLLQI